jgi:hypothetical protein
MSKNIPIITDTDRLSAVADAILARAGNPKLTKNTVLNAMAGALVGTKTNWGGLKAMNAPVHATDLDIQAETSFLEDEEDAPYHIEGTSLILTFWHQITGAEHKVAIPLAEVPALEAALFGKEATGEYVAMNATLGSDFRRNITATTRIYDGTPSEISFDGAAFAAFLTQERKNILDAIVNDGGTGDALHSAFIMVAQDHGEEMLFEIVQEYPALEEVVQEEDAEKIARRIDAASRDAVWIYLAEAAENGERLRVLRMGTHHELVNVIIDHEWPLLGDAMRSAFDAETNAT